MSTWGLCVNKLNMTPEPLCASIKIEDHRTKAFHMRGAKALVRLSVCLSSSCDKYRLFRVLSHIRIYHECEGRIEKSVPRDHRLSSRGYSC